MWFIGDWAASTRRARFLLLPPLIDGEISKLKRIDEDPYEKVYILVYILF